MQNSREKNDEDLKNKDTSFFHVNKRSKYFVCLQNYATKLRSETQPKLRT